VGHKPKVLTEDEFKAGVPGVIHLPYILSETLVNEPSKEYREFMDEYKKQHAACPECNSIRHSTTLVGYILNMDKKEEYKDLNNCCCSNCHDRHKAHDRVPLLK